MPPKKKKLKKNSYVSSVIMVLTGIKPICSVCLVSHQPLLVSLQEEMKSTKMSIWSLPHTTKISENIYCEHAKRLWSGDNWEKYSDVIPTHVAQALFRLANCMDWKKWIFGAEQLAPKTSYLFSKFLRFLWWTSSSLLLWLECLLVVGAHLLI